MSYDHSWLRPPSAAIAPSTVINNAIRAHIKRCEIAIPSRQPLLNKHQLAGSVNESVLEPALHPDAFHRPIRPKGTVWYLIPAGKAKWRNPFDGLEVPKPPPRKPMPKSKGSKESKGKEDKKIKGKAKINGPVKIRLLFSGGTVPVEEEEESDVGSRSQGSRSGSSRKGSATPMGIAQPVPLPGSRRLSLRARDILDSSSESDSSDSDMEQDIALPRIHKPPKPIIRKPPPPPLAIANSPRHTHLSHRTASSPFADLFFNSIGSPVLSSIPPFGQHPSSHSSPFPSHSLDNTTWAARQDPDRFASIETSSSSSDDETREPDWEMATGILIGGDGGDDAPVWSAEDEEMKVKEATDALKVLFPMSSPEQEVDMEPKYELNRLDNRPAQSDSSSLAESSSTATAQAIYEDRLRAPNAGASMALSAWTASSSPAPSPNLRAFANLAPDTSPTQHLSKLRSSLDPAEIDVDEDQQWLDETGELPVKAEEVLSDVDLGSTMGDAPTPEHDRQLHTAAWAREAAARIKEEPEDYPSPLTTEPDDQSAVLSHGSRASSTPSSGSSDIHPFEVESEHAPRLSLEEVIMGPESISVDELDGWLPAMQGKAEKTPQRGRHIRSRHHPQRCSGNWGSIGVGASLVPNGKPLPATKTTSMVRTRSIRSTTRRRRSSPRSHRLLTPPPTDEPDAEQELIEIDDAIGTADLEQARAEAEAREEQHRKACREKSEQQKALLEAYRQKVRESHDATPPDGLPMCDQTSPWSDLASAAGGSSESINITTPSALSPMVLQSISNLSLGNDVSAFPPSMDPTTLMPPPIPDTSLASLDEVMSQADVEAVLAAMGAPPPPVASSSTSSPSVPITSSSPAPSVEPAANTSENSTNIVDLPTTLPADVTTPEPATTSMPPPPDKAQGAFTKRLCPGVDACVVDNIPVYALVSESKSGKVVVLRRLDTDFGEPTASVFSGLKLMKTSQWHFPPRRPWRPSIQVRRLSQNPIPYTSVAPRRPRLSGRHCILRRRAGCLGAACRGEGVRQEATVGRGDFAVQYTPGGSIPTGEEIATPHRT